MDDAKTLEIEYKAMKSKIVSEMGSNDKSDRDLVIYSFEGMIKNFNFQKKIATFMLIISLPLVLLIVGIPLPIMAYFYRRYNVRQIAKFEKLIELAKNDPSFG